MIVVTAVKSYSFRFMSFIIKLLFGSSVFILFCLGFSNIFITYTIKNEIRGDGFSTDFNHVSILFVFILFNIKDIQGVLRSKEGA